MANKTNGEAVADYHKKLTTIRFHFPNAETCGRDYQKEMRDRAKELGFVNTKGVGKGDGNINAYLMHLVETDLEQRKTT